MPAARRHGFGRMVAGALVPGLVGSGALVWHESSAAFSATSSNPSNSWSAGTVNMTDNDGGTALLALANATPGQSDAGCITVTYSGSLAATVWLYATVTGSSAGHDVTVTRGSFAGGPPAFYSCTGFTADSTNYAGAGAGIVYSGTLAAYPTSVAGNLVDPTVASPESWTTNESHSYQIRAAVRDTDAAQGLSATVGLIWAARNT
jgi:hypothetical protein